MLAKLKPAWIITRREIRDQMRDWRIIIPVIVLTLIFPSLMNFTADQAVQFVSRFGAQLIGDRLIPFLLMIVGFFPISVSLVIALESFVGEKERRSIEPLLSSPLEDWQLYLGKLLAAMFPPLIASYIGIAVYLIGIYRQIGWQAAPSLLVQILILTTVQAVVMVSGAVVVSTQTTSVRAANLLASFIIIPMSFLIQGESVVMFWAKYEVLWWIVAAQLVIAGLLVRMGIAHFNREELLGRELDTLNLRWSWRVFRTAFTGSSRNIWQWYRHDLRDSLRRVRLPFAFMVLAMGMGLAAGISQASVLVIPPEILNTDNLGQGFVQGLEAVRLFSASGIGLIVWQNLRVLLLATALGIFSFGVLGILVTMLPFMIIGYFMASVIPAGISPLTFLSAFVLPHGILEIPAILLGGAAIMMLGGALAAPAKDQTIGEAWLRALANWARIMLGVVLPLLIGAAILESLVTPQVAIWVFSR